MEMRNVVTFGYLLNNLMQMPNCKSDFVVPFNDKIVIPFQELRFLRALLMDPPPGKNIKCDVGAYINKARVIVESFHLDKAKEETENALNLLLFPLLEKIMIVKSEVRDCYFKGVRQSQFSFIGIDALSFIDFVLKNLDELQKLRADSIVLLKHQIESIHGELVSLRPLLKEILEKCYEHEMKDLMACIIEVAHEAEFVINSIVVQDGPLWYHMLWISELIEEFKFIKMKLRHILKERYFITNPYAGNTSSIVSSQAHGPKEESWKLMQEKLFQKEICPVELVEVGKEIAKKCKGLPLAVAVVAGLLSRMEKKKSQWEQVAESLNSLIVKLSYIHLPNHLKPCFLYCGAFAASKEIPVQKLLRLWVAEGFVPKSELKSVEDIAEDYLMDLIGRSLITVDKTRSKGGVKTCHVHDLLRDLCLLKAKKENFLQMVNGYNELYALVGSLDDNASFHPSSPQPPRLCIQCKRADFIAWRPSDRNVRSPLFCATDDIYSQRWFYPLDFSFIFYSLKLLKVLDLSSINLGDSFPSGFEFLVHLRYLAVRGGMNFIPACIAKLLNLETLFVKGVKGEVALPDTIWKMANLRHVHIDERVSFILLNDRTALELVETLCTPSLSYGKVAENLLGCFPNLRKLKCIFLESWNQATNCNQFPVLDGLSQLESLKVFYHGRVRKSSNFIFPSNLKKLTLTKFCLPWREISKVGTLPNLEVLKLLFRAFEGKTWDMRDGEFLKLKYLKLDSLNLEQWNASSDHFPCLQRLVLLRCKKLKEIPSDLGSVPTLKAIELQWCSDSAANSAKQIQEEQIEMGNEELMLLIQTVPKWPSK
ncbi:hypothetical protein Pfo_023783 [Paulownia fortunei]|nr:hypothetical protein Pfo_023783 [Paulownia fortunei]